MKRRTWAQKRAAVRAGNTAIDGGMTGEVVLRYVPPVDAVPPLHHRIAMVHDGLPPIAASEYGPVLIISTEGDNSHQVVRLHDAATMRALGLYLLAQADRIVDAAD